MDELDLNPELLQELIFKLRAVMAQEGLVSPDSGSNPTDDETSATLQEDAGDLTRVELETRIDDLEPDQQAQLVALMWLGRGDVEPEEFAEALTLAAERHEGATAAYLLAHPHVADYLEEGVDRLMDGTDLMEDGEY
jgi:hypothetical protein